MLHPRILGSIRFRLTVLYSTLLFALAGAALAITYFAVAQTTQPRPITERQAKVYDGRQVVDRITVADVSEIELPSTSTRCRTCGTTR
jgi:hypothetical protein